MKPYKIPKPIVIPYFDHDDKSLLTTIRNSSNRRGISPLCFVIRKIRNIVLDRLAYHCPLGSWRIKMHRWRGVMIGEHCFIGMHTSIDNAYPEYIFIEDNVSIAGGNIILAHSNPMKHFENVVESGVSAVVIKNGAWIGAGAIILRGVTVGEKSIVSAGTIVEKDVPNCSIAKGNPMKIIANFESLI